MSSFPAWTRFGRGISSSRPAGLSGAGHLAEIAPARAPVWRNGEPENGPDPSIRRLVRAALAEPVPGPAHRGLVGWLLPLLEGAIREVLHEPAQGRSPGRLPGGTLESLGHQILASFLEQKLLDPERRFLAHLSRALRPAGYAAESARHFAVDALKRRGVGTELPTPPSVQELAMDPRPVGGGLVEDLLERRERASRLWGVLLEATEDERTMLRLALLGADEVPVADLERVALARGVSPAQVLTELTEAGTRRRETSFRQRQRHEDCGCRVLQLRARIARLEARIAALGEGREGPERRLSEGVLRRLECNPEAFREAGPGLRAACVAVLEARLERLEGRRQALREERIRDLGRPRLSYKALARILGLTGADAPAEEQRRAENTLYRRLERVLARLRQRARERGLLT